MKNLYDDVFPNMRNLTKEESDRVNIAYCKIAKKTGIPIISNGEAKKFAKEVVIEHPELIDDALDICISCDYEND